MPPAGRRQAARAAKMIVAAHPALAPTNTDLQPGKSGGVHDLQCRQGGSSGGESVSAILAAVWALPLKGLHRVQAYRPGPVRPACRQGSIPALGPCTEANRWRLRLAFGHLRRLSLLPSRARVRQGGGINGNDIPNRLRSSRFPPSGMLGPVGCTLVVPLLVAFFCSLRSCLLSCTSIMAFAHRGVSRSGPHR